MLILRKILTLLSKIKCNSLGISITTGLPESHIVMIQVIVQLSNYRANYKRFVFYALT